ncbi:sulfite exporter TauE/SafE family protein [Serratia nevei]|uniref:sulfite exporter TauE/SafE family protein n=1 Tax=Serratia nevei TaxID=2703794 RepID=UPI00313AC1D7
MLNKRFVPIYWALFTWAIWGTYMAYADTWYLFQENWFMSVTMALGSFIAGATSEGGGAVAFPVMVLVFDIPPSIARDFSLMIQSVGMVAASMTIVMLRIPIVWRAVVLPSLGGVCGVIFGIEVMQPMMPPQLVKLFFTSLWLSFGCVLFWTNRHADRRVVRDIGPATNSDIIRLLAVGFIGGTVSGITGSGLDLITFSLLVLFYRTCESVATPTSVVLMAINSVCAFLWMEGFGSGVAEAAWDYWLVCIPIVVVGAPLGAWFIRNKSRKFIVRILYASIVFQYIGALIILPMDMRLVLFSCSVIIAGLLCFWTAIHFGNRRLKRIRVGKPDPRGNQGTGRNCSAG